MSVQKLSDSLNNFEKAFNSIKKASKEKIKTQRDLAGIIKMFELLYETSWKCQKRLLQELGIETTNPRDTFQYSYKEGFLEEEQAWLSIIKDRNLSVHVYDEESSKELVKRIIEKHIILFEKCLKRIKAKYSSLKLK